jgi:hypothetical protein
VIEHSGNDITFEFTLPGLTEEFAFFTNYEFDVYLYSRPFSESRETYHRNWYFEESDAGTLQTQEATLAGLTGGTDYVFIVYLSDSEGQKSEPATTNTVTW